MRYLLVLLAACQGSPSAVSGGSGSAVATAPPLAADAGVVMPPRARAPKLPDPLPGKRRDAAFVGTAYRAAIGDLDGDGKNEIVLGDAKQLRVLSRDGTQLAAVDVTAGIQVIAIGDVDRDQRNEIYAGFGMTREHRDGTARIAAYRLVDGKLVEELVLAPTTTRNDITAILPVFDKLATPKDALPGSQAGEAAGLVVAYFESKYVVRSAMMRRDPKGKWTEFDLAKLRTATAYARADVDGDGKPDLVVGRVYGDDKASDGEALVLASGGTRTKLPTLRGVRELAIADADGDGQPEIYLADGWHQNYGQLARGQLTQVRFTGGAYKAELVEDMAGQYTAGKILPADVDGDHKPELVTQGSNYVRVFDRVDNHWRAVSIAGLVRDLATGDLDGKPGDEILLLADKSEIVSLSAGDFN